MKRLALSCLAATLFVLAGPAAMADSLYAEDGPNGNLIRFSRPTLGIGNVVTIVVNENNTAVSDATTNRSKDAKLGANWDFGAILPKVVKSSTALEGTDSFQGTGTTQRDGKIQVSIAATIEEVLPNGTLRVIGHKTMRVNDEDTTITVRGIVRPLDIGVDNTVDSSRVADMQIDYKGDGPATAKATPGLLTRVLNWLF